MQLLRVTTIIGDSVPFTARLYLQCLPMVSSTRSFAALTASAIIIAVVLSVSVCGEEAADRSFPQHVRPFIQKYCATCHGPDVQESNVRLDNLSADLFNDRAAAETWHEVLNVLNSGEMPPEEEVQPTAAERDEVTKSLRKQIDAVVEARSQTDGRVVLRRLNRTEYQNTMTDLLQMEMDYSRDLPPDAVSEDGFVNNGRSLQMSAMQLEYYLDTARRALDRLIVSGPTPEVFEYSYEASNLDKWRGKAVRSNRLQRQQEFLATEKTDYPEAGRFRIRVTLTADLKADKGFPLLEVSFGYRPDTQILMESFELIEVTSEEQQTFEFIGRLEEFPLPVRGQGKYPGIVTRIRNVYDDGSPLPKGDKEKKKKAVYPDEPDLPAIHIESVEFTAPLFDKWPPANHCAVLFESELRSTDEPAYMAEVLQKFMRRAFRRPVTATEVQRYVSFFKSIRAEFPTFEQAVRETLAMVLVSPDFLYLIEPADDTKRATSDWELASRLSYFLWSTMPDESLLADADGGVLHNDDVLRAQVSRMIADPRVNAFVDQFTEQWLQLNYIDNIAVDMKEHRGFNDELRNTMVAETRSLFAELLKENRSCDHFLSSDFTMLNERLARHYDIDGVQGNEFRRVSLAKSHHRGGLLSHASIMLINSDGRDSHPVRRAVWLRDRLLNDPPAPPPPDVPSLEDATDPDFLKLSVREQLEVHRQKDACDSCHRNIDPWGIALENFDAVGKWRTRLKSHGRKHDVNAAATLPSGDAFAGADELKSYLLAKRREQFARSLVSRLMTYALGRRLELSDQPIVDDIVADSLENGFRLADLVQEVAASPVFLTK